MSAFGRNDAFPREEYRCLPPEDIQQNSNSTDRIEPLELADQFGECAVNDLDPLAGLDVPVPVNRAFIVAALLQPFDDARG